MGTDLVHHFLWGFPAGEGGIWWREEERRRGAIWHERTNGDGVRFLANMERKEVAPAALYGFPWGFIFWSAMVQWGRERDGAGKGRRFDGQKRREERVLGVAPAHGSGEEERRCWWRR